MNKYKRTEEIEKLKKEFIVDPDILGPFYDFEIIRVKQEEVAREMQSIATEIPFTIIANDIEIATLLCLPINLKELTLGFLFTSNLIDSIEDFQSFGLDTSKWVAHCELSKTPDPEIMRKRLYTSGCGKGVMYSRLNEISSRYPLESNLTVSKEKIQIISKWLQHCSKLYRITGCVHTTALSREGQIPEIFMDDIGRHNAVDKVIGKGLLDGLDFSKYVLISSGRTSSEILQKAKRIGIAISISRGAPTHQTILRARDMGITVVGFARSGTFVIYSHEQRITI